MSLHRSTLDLIYAVRATSPRSPCVHHCGRPARHGLTTCYHRQANRDWRAQCRTLGRCQRCPAPAVDGRTCCRPCLDKLAAKARERRAANRAV